MADDWVERKTLLVVGNHYRVTRGAESPNDKFDVGERLRFRISGYSRYDSCYVYEFEADDGVLKSFWLHDGDPAERLTSVFEPA